MYIYIHIYTNQVSRGCAICLFICGRAYIYSYTDDTAGIQSRFGVFLEDTKAGKDEKKNVQVEEKDETEDLAKVLYTPTLQQEEELEEISKFCKDTCTKLDVHTDVNFDDPLQCVHVLAALTVDLAGVLKFSVIEAKSMSDDIEMHQVYVYMCLCVCVSIRMDVNTSICS